MSGWSSRLSVQSHLHHGPHFTYEAGRQVMSFFLPSSPFPAVLAFSCRWWGRRVDWEGLSSTVLAFSCHWWGRRVDWRGLSSAVLAFMNFFKMACSPIFGFFQYTFLQWFSLGPIGQVEYYGTPWRRLTAILADLQAIIGYRQGKHWNSLKMHSDGCHLLWGSKIIKNHKKKDRGH